MNVIGVIVLFLYLGFGATTNEFIIGKYIDQFLNEEKPNESRELRTGFSWMCSILWILFWPLFLVWAMIDYMLHSED